ncbi:N-acetylmuramoyl-L-alanine amidase [Microbulbifer sp. CnH-101-E]|uniref:peptidoglycan recognition protein family protein n=1 Tax=unclassified Microbulbifer TaxID=2619833 RepID=UPI00403A2B26
MPYQLTWLPSVLEDAGLKIAEVDGWASRGNGNMSSSIKGIVCHHTAGAAKGNMPSLNTLKNGRRDLSGPLAQLGLARDGTYYIIAAGKANHAGSGSWKGVSGNRNVIGIEAENTGYAKSKNGKVADPWPEVQLDAYKRGVAAILAKLGRDSSWCCGHKEWKAKPDPHTIDMDEFRKDVQSIMDRQVPPPLIPTKDSQDRPTLRRGNSSNLRFVVRDIQRKIGFPDDKIDGHFGPITEAAIRKFQRDNGLVPDGIIGPRTWTILDSI